MSVTKRVWIENDPAYEDVGKALQDEIKTYLEPFTERLGLRKFCKIEGKRRLDITWSMAVFEAVNQLAAERVIVDDGMLFRSKAVRDAVRKSALEKHVGLFEKYGLKPPKRCPKCNEKMRVLLAKTGRSKGRLFWGCTGFPACRFTEDSSDAQNESLWEYRRARLVARTKANEP